MSSLRILCFSGSFSFKCFIANDDFRLKLQCSETQLLHNLINIYFFKFSKMLYNLLPVTNVSKNRPFYT